MFAWSRNFYAISGSGIEYCFESKKSRDGAVKCFDLKPIFAKECTSLLRVHKVYDYQYRRIRSKYLFYDDGKRSNTFDMEMGEVNNDT